MPANICRDPGGMHLVRCPALADGLGGEAPLGSQVSSLLLSFLRQARPHLSGPARACLPSAPASASHPLDRPSQKVQRPTGFPHSVFVLSRWAECGERWREVLGSPWAGTWRGESQDRSEGAGKEAVPGPALPGHGSAPAGLVHSAQGGGEAARWAWSAL